MNVANTHLLITVQIIVHKLGRVNHQLARHSRIVAISIPKSVQISILIVLLELMFIQILAMKNIKFAVRKTPLNVNHLFLILIVMMIQMIVHALLRYLLILSIRDMLSVVRRNHLNVSKVHVNKILFKAILIYFLSSLIKMGISI